MVQTPIGRTPAEAVFKSLWQVHRALQQLTQRQVEADGMNIHQLASLLHLHEHGGATPGELSVALGITRASVSGLLNRLEEQELAERAMDPVDKRVVRVALTPKGRAIAEDRDARFVMAQKALLADWSEEDLHTLTGLLDRLGQRFGEALEREPLPPPQVEYEQETSGA